ncbi:hypothetical protein BVY03_01760 [bacterium K02(2017)]|nr:hypothetical protein BVY03_01760 [bacterium K02(2017)]
MVQAAIPTIFQGQVNSLNAVLIPKNLASADRLGIKPKSLKLFAQQVETEPEQEQAAPPIYFALAKKEDGSDIFLKSIDLGKSFYELSGARSDDKTDLASHSTIKFTSELTVDSPVVIPPKPLWSQIAEALLDKSKPKEPVITDHFLPGVNFKTKQSFSKTEELNKPDINLGTYVPINPAYAFYLLSSAEIYASLPQYDSANLAQFKRAHQFRRTTFKKLHSSRKYDKFKLAQQLIQAAMIFENIVTHSVGSQNQTHTNGEINLAAYCYYQAALLMDSVSLGNTDEYAQKVTALETAKELFEKGKNTYGSLNTMFLLRLEDFWYP